MAGKHIRLIVSSASSGISSVVSDAKRLIPNGNFVSDNLWIRSSQTSRCSSLIADWLKNIDYESITSGISSINADKEQGYTLYNMSGERVEQPTQPGIYIARSSNDSRKIIVNR